MSSGDPDIDALLADCLAVMQSKGRDYTMEQPDRLHNFRTVGAFVDVPMPKVWATYFYKHVTAIFTFIKTGGQSESEPIRGRVVDCIVYLLLFGARMLKELEAKGKS